MIQYLIAAGIGGYLGRKARKKKYALGGSLSKFDSLNRLDILGNVYSTKGETLKEIKMQLEEIGMKIVQQSSQSGYDEGSMEYQIVIEPMKEITDTESEAIERFFKKIDTTSYTRNGGDYMSIEFKLD